MLVIAWRETFAPCVRQMMDWGPRLHSRATILRRRLIAPCAANTGCPGEYRGHGRVRSGHEALPSALREGREILFDELRLCHPTPARYLVKRFCPTFERNALQPIR